jgi:hypothetical protein
LTVIIGEKQIEEAKIAAIRERTNVSRSSRNYLPDGLRTENAEVATTMIRILGNRRERKKRSRTTSMARSKEKRE